MRQINFVYDSINDFLDSLDTIYHEVNRVSPSNALLHLYFSGISSQQAKTVLEAIDKHIPDVPRIGISEYPAYKDTKKSLLKCNLIIANNAQFYSYHVPCVRGMEKERAVSFVNDIKNIPYIKAIEICSANQDTDTSTFIETLGEKYPETAIFGSLSKPASIIDNTLINEDDSFHIGKDISSEGYTIVLYAGENLEVNLHYIQSWRPIGKKMALQLDEKPLLGSSAISKIDGISAVKIFYKYLGIPGDDTFLNNAWYLPLIITRNNINICFTPIGCNRDTIYYGGRIYKDDKIRFSYCTIEEILDASFEECKKIKEQSPDVLMLIICGNRYAFMKDEEITELEYYKNCVSNFTYCHAYGEIAYKSNIGGLLNSALVYISMRESQKSSQIVSASFSIPQIRKFKYSTIPVSFIVSHFFHQMTCEIMHYQKHLEDEVNKITQENFHLTVSIVQTLAETIDAKDRYTKGHSNRVAEYSREIAKRYGYSEKKLDEVYMVGLLHDIGKIGIPDYVINKRSKLTDEEYAVIKKHPIIGAHILGSIKEKPDFLTGAKWHHERYDGTGYPDGLKGTNIPEIARIIAVADAYDAMTSNRSYRDALPQKYVRYEIASGKGRQFDPQFADIMLQMIDSDTAYSMRESQDKSSRYPDCMDFTPCSSEVSLRDADYFVEHFTQAHHSSHLSLSQLVDFGQYMPGGFLVYKAGGEEELLYVNTIVLEIFGCHDLAEFKALTGFTFPGMVHEKDIERVKLSIIEQVEKDDNNLDYVEYRIRRKNGEIRWVDERGRLVSTVEYGDVFYVLLRDITEQHNSLELLTNIDHLTKVFNRRHLDRELQKTVCRLIQFGGSMSMIMVDIDSFKKFNDLYGHYAGDKCLTQVAQAMQQALRRKDDMLFRYGGEEFAVLLPGALLENAALVAENLRVAVRNLDIFHERGPHGIVTISIGVASFTGEEASNLPNPAAALVNMADKALYEAKNSGGDVVKIARENRSDE